MRFNMRHLDDTGTTNIIQICLEAFGHYCQRFPRRNKHKVHTSCDVIVRHIRTMHVAQDPDLLIKGLFLSLIF